MIPGYDKLANLIATDPCVSLYPRFTKANAKNLIYLQAEISLVLDELDDIVGKDFESGDPGKELFPVSVYALQTFRSADGEMCEQWKKALELRRLLKEYNDCIIQQRQIMQLPKANTSDLDFMRKWLRGKEGGDGFLPTIEADPWKTDDFVCLQGRDEGMDRLTRWIYDKLIPWYHRNWGHLYTKYDVDMGIYNYDDRAIKLFVGVISVIVSAFPSLSSQQDHSIH